MSVVQTVHLRVRDPGPSQVIHAVQNDTDRQVRMVLDDLTLTSGLTGAIYFLRSDGTYYNETATLDTTTNSFVADLDQALTCPGRTIVHLKVTDTDVVSSFQFNILVERDTSGVVSEQEGISLTEAIEAAEDAAERAETAASSLSLDTTLTIAGKAADAKAVGDAIAAIEPGGGGSGLTEAVKQALLACFAKVAWIDANGQTYYDALEDALYEAATYTITNNLTDVTNSNNATSIAEGSSYTATLTPVSGTITHLVITMGGVDITNSAFTPNS